MSATQKRVVISDWCSLDRRTEVFVMSLDVSTRHSIDTAGRMVIGLDTGMASVILRPTAEEARALIAALQWALQPVTEVAAS